MAKLPLDAMLTDEDSDIQLDRLVNANPHTWIRNRRQEDRDAAIMRSLLRTRRNNRRARANAEEYCR